MSKHLKETRAMCISQIQVSLSLSCILPPGSSHLTMFPPTCPLRIQEKRAKHGQKQLHRCIRLKLLLLIRAPVVVFRWTLSRLHRVHPQVPQIGRHLKVSLRRDAPRVQGAALEQLLEDHCHNENVFFQRIHHLQHDFLKAPPNHGITWNPVIPVLYRV